MQGQAACRLRRLGATDMATDLHEDKIGGSGVARLRVPVLQNTLVSHQQKRPNSAEPPSMRQLSTPE